MIENWQDFTREENIQFIMEATGEDEVVAGFIYAVETGEIDGDINYTMPTATKHLPGKHDQKSHGRGGAGASAYIDPDPAEMERYYNAKGQCADMPDPCTAIGEYTFYAYQPINSDLRAGIEPTDYDKASFETMQFTRPIDKWIDEAPRTPEDMKVRRAIDRQLGAQLTDGTVFQDKGFVSTTLLRGADYDKTIGRSANMEIRVPKGSKGAYIDQISSVEQDFPGERGEQEFLLPRGSKFKVLSNETNPEGVMNIVVELSS